MTQLSFSAMERSAHGRVTRKQKFLAEMERVVPWERLLAVIQPHYPAGGKRGRPPIALSKMLRLYFLQQWFNLSDEALEDQVYDVAPFRDFVGLDLMRESVPDATTLLQFRRRLERESLTEAIFEQIKGHLKEQGLLLHRGTLVDATLIAAPPSTKNRAHGRDPEMHQSKKGNQWYFGMKAHIGVDADSGLIHSLVTTAGNVSDVSQTHALLHGQELTVHLDAGYIGAERRAEVVQAQADGHLRADVQWQIAAKRGGIKAMAEGPLKEALKAIETCKAKIRSQVEHPFHVVKNLFGYRKVRYKGLAKNTAQQFTLMGLANLVIAKRSLLDLHGSIAS